MDSPATEDEAAESMWRAIFLFSLLSSLLALFYNLSSTSTTKVFQHLGCFCVGGAGDQILLCVPLSV